MNEKSVSKLLSYALRHHPHKLELILDKGGWAKTDDVIKALADRNIFTNKNELEQIDKTNSKQRLVFEGDRMRAASGHSIPIDLKYEPVVPPEILYHGTATRFVDSIMKEGIIKGSRHDVHLSEDVSTAKQVGSRHGHPVVLQVDTYQMHKDGYLFRETPYNVWLVDFVPPEYLKIVRL